MLRENWKAPGFWRWWWRNHVPPETKWIGLAVVVLLLSVAGFVASGSLSGASAANDRVLQTTVTRSVTVRHNGKTVVKRVPVVVRRSVVRQSTAYSTVVDTRVVTAPGGASTVVDTRVVTSPGGMQTVVAPPRTKTSVVTNERTVTSTSTVVQPVTTTTVQTRTVTPPPETVTRTQTATVVQTVTVTVPTSILP